MKVCIVEYNAGNVQSVVYALERLGVEACLTHSHEELAAADKVIFPGVGEASSAMQHLKSKGLDKVIPALKQPTLGICLGMQLMCQHSEENDTDCLRIFDLKVRKFNSDTLKVPHVGWNTISNLSSAVFAGLSEQEYMYYVHSYYAEKGKETIASTYYTLEYSAALAKGNFYAMQFHPEKSSKAGQAILHNFLVL